MSDILKQFEATGKKALDDLKQIKDLDSLETFRIKYLSRKGQITSLLGQLGKLPKELKPQAGQLANKIKKEVTTAFDTWRDQNLANIHSHLQSQSIYSIGRYGEWKYSSMQEAFLDGKNVVEKLNLVGARSPDTRARITDLGPGVDVPST